MNENDVPKVEARMMKFLDENHPGENKCLLVKNKKDRFYCIECFHDASKHRMYIVNSHMAYDYDFEWAEDENPWEVIYKSE